MRRLAILPLLALPLLAAAWGYVHFDVSAEQLARNEARWAALDEAERDALRERWLVLRRELRDDDAQAGPLLRRLGTLNRLIHELGPGAPDDALLAHQLATLPQRIQSHLELPAEVAEQPDRLVALLREDTLRRMNAFLANLTHEGRVDDADLAAFWQAGWDGKVGRALELLKREALFFAAEAPREELEELEELPPLDLAARQEQLRRRRGLVGRAGELLDLDPAERARLMTLGEDEFAAAFRDVVRPAARELLLEQGVDPARVDEIVVRPYRSLERMVERVLRARR